MKIARVLAPMLGLALLASAGAALAQSTSLTFGTWELTEPGRGERIAAVLDGFNKAQDAVVLEPINIPYPRYAETILTQLAAGEGPDVFIIEADTYFMARAQGLLADISAVVDTTGIQMAAADSIVTGGGVRTGIVYATNNYGLIVNRALLDAAGVAVPTNYAAFEAAARALTTDGRFGFAMRHMSAEEGGWWFDLSNWVYGAGGAWTDADGRPSVNSPQVVEGVRRFAHFATENLIPRGTDAATYRRMMWEGQVAMVIDNGAVPAILLSQNPALALEAYPAPFEDPTNAQIAAFMVVNANSDKLDAAGDFLQWVLTPEVQNGFVDAFGGALGTGTATASPSEAIAAANPWIRTYHQIAAHGRLIAPFGQEGNTARFRTEVLSQVDRVINLGIAPQEAMDEAQAALEQILR